MRLLMDCLFFICYSLLSFTTAPNLWMCHRFWCEIIFKYTNVLPSCFSMFSSKRKSCCKMEKKLCIVIFSTYEKGRGKYSTLLRGRGEIFCEIKPKGWCKKSLEQKKTNKITLDGFGLKSGNDTRGKGGLCLFNTLFQILVFVNVKLI